MSRPLRIEYENAFYHVMNRGRGRQAIFHNSAYYEAFLDSIEETHQRFGLVVHAYCLMNNHYHLLVQTPRDKLSRCMRHVNGVYTQRYNRMKKTDGPLFRGRYKAILVDAEAYVLPLSRYIHRNPIEAHQPLGWNLADYSWSSYPAYVNHTKAPSWLERDFTYRLLGQNRRYAGYMRYVDQDNDQELIDFYDQSKLKPILGTERFIQRVLGDRNSEPIRSRLTRSLERMPDLAVIVARVADHAGMEISDIVHSSRGRGSKNIPRWVAITLARELSGRPLAEIARYFHMNHISGISKVVNQLFKHEQQDRKVARMHKVLYQDLTP
ncbi:MAG: transposase [Gammaproteobacteria bacterium]|nr:transposase [Gammaproteobacteria bacterium]